jgi:hypothetical protein
LESAGLKISHLPILTSTDESDCRAVWASGIGPSGVSAQATKPASKATNANEVASITLLRLRTSFHPSCGTAARICTTSTCSQVEVRMWAHSLITAHATLHICGTWLVTPDHGTRNTPYMRNVVGDTAYPSQAGTRLLSQLKSGCLGENYSMPPSESAQLRFLFASDTHAERQRFCGIARTQSRFQCCTIRRVVTAPLWSTSLSSRSFCQLCSGQSIALCLHIAISTAEHRCLCSANGRSG